VRFLPAAYSARDLRRVTRDAELATQNPERGFCLRPAACGLRPAARGAQRGCVGSLLKAQPKGAESRIVVLDESVANKIAAGEVIERPASVVKELVENSIDAGATRIAIDIEVGGRRLIRAADNGCGMTPQEAILSLQRHATSKIRTAKDLFSVSTLGFRGEALPSIASVSKMQLVTRTRDAESATKVEVAGGQITDVTEIGAPPGTEICVGSLFFNTPARYKFMKSAAAEGSRITAIVSRFCMSRHDIAFRLTSGGRRIIDSAGASELGATLSYVFGRESFAEMIPFDLRSGPIRAHGYTSGRALTRANRSGIATFVNRRLIHSPALLQVVGAAYREELPQGRFPMAAIYIEIDPRLVDVNVHPAKAEVKFADERRVLSVVRSAIEEALSRSGVLPRAPGRVEPPPQAIVARTPEQEIPLPIKPDSEPAKVKGEQEVGPARPAARAAEVQEADTTDRSAIPPHDVRTSAPPASGKGEPEPGPEPSPARLPDPAEDLLLDSRAAETPAGLPSRAAPELRSLGQVHDSWIVAQSPDGLVIIDQHAAHERIVYERCLRDSLESATQRLLVPLTLDLGRVESQAVVSNLDILGWLGFETEEFGAASFVVRSVPAMVADKSYVEVFRDIIDELVHDLASGESKAEAAGDGPLDSQRREIAARCACKMAVKSGDRLSADEINRLIADLAAAQNNRTCPHGRPTMLSLTKDFLERKFKRK
jgi:DNA mismatch repair protein MutL